MAVVTVRDALDVDAAVVSEIVDASYGHYIERIGRPPAPMTCDYAELIDRGVVRVATLDGVPVGVIVMWAEDDHWYVDNVAVRPGLQGSGIGQSLLADAERAAREGGRGEIRLYTNAAMTENIAYYPRRGFTETHRGVEHGFERVYYRKPVV